MVILLVIVVGVVVVTIIDEVLVVGVAVVVATGAVNAVAAGLVLALAVKDANTAAVDIWKYPRVGKPCSAITVEYAISVLKVVSEPAIRVATVSRLYVCSM